MADSKSELGRWRSPESGTTIVFPADSGWVAMIVAFCGVDISPRVIEQRHTPDP
ncbi:MAG: hypothetical protein KDA84_17220 [Planctomycetaceae bacterium]|nr:hypothetical protein [Planctomycetaceae bacterium]